MGLTFGFAFGTPHFTANGATPTGVAGRLKGGPRPLKMGMVMGGGSGKGGGSSAPGGCDAWVEVGGSAGDDAGASATPGFASGWTGAAGASVDVPPVAAAADSAGSPATTGGAARGAATRTSGAQCGRETTPSAGWPRSAQHRLFKIHAKATGSPMELLLFSKRRGGVKRFLLLIYLALTKNAL